jgi:hypothetical protein
MSVAFRYVCLFMAAFGVRARTLARAATAL